jgi:hypothetical protein
MSKTIGIALIGLGLSAGLAAAQGLQPLKVKTGLWQLTQSVTWSGHCRSTRQLFAMGGTTTNHA